MKDILFDGKINVTQKEVLERLDYYIGLAEKGMKLHEYDRKKAFKLAQQIRSYLKSEYKNNDLLQTYKQYKRNDYFLTYKKAIHETFVSVTGPLIYGVCQVSCRI